MSDERKKRNLRHNGTIVLPSFPPGERGGAWTLDELRELAREQGVLDEDPAGSQPNGN